MRCTESREIKRTRLRLCKKGAGKINKYFRHCDIAYEKISYGGNMSIDVGINAV
jgi:hypothetical protein